MVYVPYHCLSTTPKPPDVAMFMVKGYVELYEGRMKKVKVNYQNFKQTTHLVLGLWCLSALFFHIALWPHYGWNTPLVLGFAGFGVVLQFLLLFPNTLIQNAVAFVALTFLLQQYA